MKTPENELTVYYHPDMLAIRRILAFAHAESNFVHEVDLSRMDLSEQEMDKLVKKLHLPISDLIDVENPLFPDKDKKDKLNKEDWLKILMHSPQLFRAPIAIMGDKAKIINNPIDIFALQESGD